MSTVDVGPVHVLREPGGGCTPDCPHPEHQQDWWHVYRSDLPDDDGTITLTIGPTDLGPTSRGLTGHLPSDVAFATDALNGHLDLTYVGTFDHPPTDRDIEP